MLQTKTLSSLRRYSLWFGLVVAYASFGCNNGDSSPPATEIDEAGTWVLNRAQLKSDPEFRQTLTEAQSESFLMHFDQEAQVVVIAGCSSSKGKEPDIRTSGCSAKSDPKEHFWTCHCFDYEFIGEEMKWTHTKTKTPDGDAPLPAIAAEVTAGKTSVLRVYPDPVVNSLAVFTPLPNFTSSSTGGVFQSDGKVSRYEFLHRSRLVPLKESKCLDVCGAAAD